MPACSPPQESQQPAHTSQQLDSEKLHSNIAWAGLIAHSWAAHQGGPGFLPTPEFQP